MEHSKNFGFALPSRDNDVDLADINEIANNFRKVDENAVKKEDIDQALSQIKIPVDNVMSNTSENPVQNKIVKAYVDEKENNINQQIDILNQGGLNLKEDFIGEQVNSWLDEHPEATTTVQDGSLEEIKFTDNLKYKAIKDYVTPEMYKDLVKPVTIKYTAIRKNGATVTGLSKTFEDWWDAIQKAVDEASRSQKPVLLTQLYYIDKPIEIIQTVKIFGASANNPLGDHTLTKIDLDGVKRRKFPASCGLLHRKSAIQLKQKEVSDGTKVVGAGIGIKLDSIVFAQAYKESDPNDGEYRTIDVFLNELTNSGGANAIEVFPTGSGNFSKLSVVNCDFLHTAGYGVKFMPVATGENSYYQMFEFKNNSFWTGCGGIVCAKTEDAELSNTKGAFITCATLDNINLDNGSYMSEFMNGSIVDLSGMREYTLTNVVLEGSGSGALEHPLVRISNSRWQTINGIHAELGSSYQTALEIVSSGYLKEGSKNGSLFLYNVPTPILVTAENTEVHLFGLYSASEETNKPLFEVTGKGSSVIVDTMIMMKPSYNIFNLNALGKYTYKNLSTIGSTDKLPVSFQKPVTIFEWNAKKGALYDDSTKKYFENDYYKLLIPAKSNWDLENSGLINDVELGYVYRIVSAINSTAQFQVNFLGDAQKNALIGKRVSLSITYRAKVNGETVTFNASNIKGGNDGASLINNSILDEVAIGVTSIVVNEANTGFTITAPKNDDGNKHLDIIGIKISIGNEVEGMPLVFSI